MKRKHVINKGIILVAALATISGCAGNHDLISKASMASRQDIFTDVTGAETQVGKAVVEFTCSVKSNSSQFMWFYNKHSNPPYQLHLSIDGQATTVESEPVLEDKSSSMSKDPEAGTGWKYEFSKRVVLAPGNHKLTVTLPVDDVLVEKEITLGPGKSSITIMPVYKEKLLRPYKGQHFSAGVKGVEIRVSTLK